MCQVQEQLEITWIPTKLHWDLTIGFFIYRNRFKLIKDLIKSNPFPICAKQGDTIWVNNSVFLHQTKAYISKVDKIFTIGLY